MMGAGFVLTDAGCDIKKDCHSNATCLWVSENGGSYECRCNDGFVGDGSSVCEKEVIGCNIINDCGLHASCRFNGDEGGYRCTCDGARVKQQEFKSFSK